LLGTNYQFQEAENRFQAAENRFSAIGFKFLHLEIPGFALGKARGGWDATKNATWMVCLILYLIAITNFFGIIHVGPLASWAWIVGYAVLLISEKVRGL